MKNYNYLEAVTADVIDFIRNEVDSPVQSSRFGAVLSQQTDPACLAAFQGAFSVILLCSISYALSFALECL